MYIYIIYYYIYTIYSCICNILNKFNHNKTLTVKREGMELVLKAEILCRKGLHVCVCGGGHCPQQDVCFGLEEQLIQWLTLGVMVLAPSDGNGTRHLNEHR